MANFNLSRLSIGTVLIDNPFLFKSNDFSIKTIGISNAIEEGIIISSIKSNEEALACEARAVERLIDFYLEII